MLDGFDYVYVLTSLTEPDCHYTGCTADLDARPRAHNSGQCPHTSKFGPWRIETTIAFRSKEKALAFERYLKSHSGRAFASKHFQGTATAWRPERIRALALAVQSRQTKPWQARGPSFAVVRQTETAAA